MNFFIFFVSFFPKRTFLCPEGISYASILVPRIVLPSVIPLPCPHALKPKVRASPLHPLTPFFASRSMHRYPCLCPSAPSPVHRRCKGNRREAQLRSPLEPKVSDKGITKRSEGLPKVIQYGASPLHLLTPCTEGA